MIELKQFEKHYGKKTLYETTNLTIPHNAISFLMGKNGCGKTTLLKCIAGLESYEGEILFDGKPLPEVRDQLLVIWDDSPCFSNLNGLQNLELLCEGRKPKKAITEAGERYLGLDVLRRKVKTYSYGQKKKLMLALADLLEPAYLVMDEISNGLDVDMMDELAEHLLKGNPISLVVVCVYVLFLPPLFKYDICNVFNAFAKGIFEFAGPFSLTAVPELSLLLSSLELIALFALMLLGNALLTKFRSAYV
ncbi:MAG: ATP-binding cassette domain-containing protein [Oscillospiraceae bacterium]|nr:ATP-binding cassette domain-containing protein [Ruminococcus sp.]MBQ4346744.1 ATP-binding cassette domain-containing protein [Oscillospiraceae bacterium]